MPPDSDVKIRVATASDVDAVIRFWIASAEPTVADDRVSLEHLLAHDPETLLLAEADGAIVGTLVAAWDGWRGNIVPARSGS